MADTDSSSVNASNERVVTVTAGDGVSSVLVDNDASSATDELSGESPLDEVTMLFPHGTAVVQLGNQHHSHQQTHHIPIVGGPTIISTGNFQGQNSTTAASANDGPFYVVMTPSSDSIITSQHSTLTPGSRRSRALAVNALTVNDTVGSGGNRTARDEKRRATHNEVERRRRDKINNWIVKLAKVVPDCTQDNTKQGQSKGGILAKACEYIADLTSENNRLNEVARENELLSNELDSTRQELFEVKNENKKLKSLLQRHGLLDANGQSVASNSSNHDHQVSNNNSGGHDLGSVANVQQQTTMAQGQQQMS